MYFVDFTGERKEKLGRKVGNGCEKALVEGENLLEINVKIKNSDNIWGKITLIVKVQFFRKLETQSCKQPYTLIKQIERKFKGLWSLSKNGQYRSSD